MATLNGYGLLTAQTFQNMMFNYGEFTKPAVSVYIALSTSLIDWDNPATMTEPTGGAYIRKEVPTTTAWWTLADSSEARVENMQDIVFTKSTASWGTIVAFAVMRTVSGVTLDDMLWGGVLETPKTIEADTIAIFQTNDLSITSTNAVVP